MNDKDGRDEDEQKSDTVIGRRCWSETNWERERERVSGLDFRTLMYVSA